MTPDEPEESYLPDGPGLWVRWLVAVPMMAVSMFAPWFGQVTLSVWWFDTADPFWTEFESRLSDLGWFPLYLPTFVLTWFLLRRTRLGGWPTACLVVSCLLLVPGMLLSLFGIGLGGLLPNIAFCLGLGWLSWELGRQVQRVLTWPPAWDLVRSDLEIVYRSPVGRLRLRRDHLAFGADVLPLERLKEARVADAELRIRGGKKTRWRIPADEDTAHALVAAIEARR